MSDHGAWGWDDIAPMFFLKRSGETHSSMCINSSPVSYQDFQATILELIGKHDGSLGTSIFDWKPGQERRRVLMQITMSLQYLGQRGMNTGDLYITKI